MIKTPKRNKKSGHTENDHEEHIISIIGSLLRNLKEKNRDRLIAKFVELDHAKTDRLLELHFKYMDKVDEGKKTKNISFSRTDSNGAYRA